MEKIRKLVPSIVLSIAIAGCASQRYEGVISRGPYSGAKAVITETENMRKIEITSKSDYITYESLELTAIDEGKDEIYETITLRLEGKQTSRSPNHIPTDLSEIIKQIK